MHTTHEFSDYNEKQNHNAYFEAVASSLKEATKILMFGSGTGSSATMDQFVLWLKVHQGSVAERVVGAITVDLSHLTESQLLMRANDFFGV